MSPCTFAQLQAWHRCLPADGPASPLGEGTLWALLGEAAAFTSLALFLGARQYLWPPQVGEGQEQAPFLKGAASTLIIWNSTERKISRTPTSNKI